LFMDCSFNVTMQPFRALVGDMVNDKQRNQGYATQSFLTNIGAVVGSFLPFVLTWIGTRNVPLGGEKVPPSVIGAFYIGGAVLLLTVIWTSIRVKEYPPKEYAEYNNILQDQVQKESFFHILKTIPPTMLQLAIVQFFSWFALFLMWVYATDGIANNVWHTNDPHSQAYNIAGNWNGVLSGVYGVFAALFSIVMAKLATEFGRKWIYSIALIAGALGLMSMSWFTNQYMLIVSMLGVGIAWAAILAMPYAILSKVLPANKMGVYMGLFNATITIPQIASGLCGGLIFKYIVGSHSILMLVVAGISMLLAAGSVVFVKDSR
jgi:maltose/moltooligosaccharide transporter